MCFPTYGPHRVHKWNWDGDTIIHDPIVPSSRTIPSTNEKFPIDVREFLISEKNAIIQRTLREDILGFIPSLPHADTDLFKSRRSGAFDYKANVITAFVARQVAYQDRLAGDPWLFPDETLHLRAGDCEDRALLIASLMRGAGISPFNVRVALGKLRYHENGSARMTSEHDHVWVMYKTETGRWRIIEPQLDLSEQGSSRRQRSGRHIHPSLDTSFAEYIPYFLFNDHHLWGVGKHGVKYQDYIKRRKRWLKFTPKFAGKVHKSILNAALDGIADPMLVQFLNDSFTHISLPLLINEDVDTYDSPFEDYNPYQHFDNAFIKEGWDFVTDNLKTFSKHKNDYDSFGKAAHGIADFYSHTSYGQFGTLVPGQRAEDDALQLFDPVQDMISPQYVYTQYPFDLVRRLFSTNRYYWKEADRQKIADTWNGKIVSGRYGQKSDTKRWWKLGEMKAWAMEVLVSIDSSYHDQNFSDRAALPHHNEIAVDGEEKDALHGLYENKPNALRNDRISFENQFRWRKNTAINHIRKAYQDCLAGIV